MMPKAEATITTQGKLLATLQIAADDRRVIHTPDERPTERQVATAMAAMHKRKVRHFKARRHQEQHP